VLIRSFRRNGNNALYPYATVLPDGNVYLFVGQLSSILDTSSPTFQEVSQLPTLLDFQGQNEGDAHSRNYPGSGSALFLPLDPSTGYTAKVLICGGGHADNGRDSIALNTCGTIEPLSNNPEWEYSEMIGPRVMLDTVLLPNEQVLIVNGASLGMAVLLRSY
jgi:hypothetical protein